MSDLLAPNEELPLLETIDHLLDRGVVIAGEAVISIGDVDLLYLGLNVILANVDAVIRTSRRK
ncbi:MAG TPA: gas vesicle protein GvpJ [Thermoanaerobaculia bacterium]